MKNAIFSLITNFGSEFIIMNGIHRSMESDMGLRQKMVS